MDTALILWNKLFITNRMRVNIRTALSLHRIEQYVSCLLECRPCAKGHLNEKGLCKHRYNGIVTYRK